MKISTLKNIGNGKQLDEDILRKNKLLAFNTKSREEAETKLGIEEFKADTPDNYPKTNSYSVTKDEKYNQGIIDDGLNFSMKSNLSRNNTEKDIYKDGYDLDNISPSAKRLIVSRVDNISQSSISNLNKLNNDPYNTSLNFLSGSTQDRNYANITLGPNGKVDFSNMFTGDTLKNISLATSASLLGITAGDINSIISIFSTESSKVNKLDDWKSEYYKDIHTYDWKPGLTMPQPLLEDEETLFEDIGQAFGFLDGGFGKWYSSVKSLKPDTLNLVRSNTFSSKYGGFLAENVSFKFKNKKSRWQRTGLTSNISDDILKTSSEDNKIEELPRDLMGNMVNDNHVENHIKEVNNMNVFMSNTVRGNDLDTIEYPNHVAENKKRINSILTNRNSYYKTVGYLYVRHINNDDAFTIPFEFNPRISESASNAEYVSEKLMNRIGQYFVYTGTSLSQIGINLNYLALAPDPEDETEGGNKTETETETNNTETYASWQNFWSDSRLKEIEYKLRSLVLPSVMNDEAIVEPPIIEIHLYPNGVNAIEDIYKYPNNMKTDSLEKDIEEKKASKNYFRISKSFNGGENYSIYKKYIVTSVQIESSEDNDIAYSSIYKADKDGIESNLKNENKIINFKGNKNSLYARRRSFKASLNCTEVTENFLDVPADFKAYKAAWTNLELGSDEYSYDPSIVNIAPPAEPPADAMSSLLNENSNRRSIDEYYYLLSEMYNFYYSAHINSKDILYDYLRTKTMEYSYSNNQNINSIASLAEGADTPPSKNEDRESKNFGFMNFEDGVSSTSEMAKIPVATSLSINDLSVGGLKQKERQDMVAKSMYYIETQKNENDIRIYSKDDNRSTITKSISLKPKNKKLDYGESNKKVIEFINNYCYLDGGDSEIDPIVIPALKADIKLSIKELGEKINSIKNVKDYPNDNDKKFFYEKLNFYLDSEKFNKEEETILGDKDLMTLSFLEHQEKYLKDVIKDNKKYADKFIKFITKSKNVAVSDSETMTVKLKKGKWKDEYNKSIYDLIKLNIDKELNYNEITELIIEKLNKIADKIGFGVGIENWILEITNSDFPDTPITYDGHVMVIELMKYYTDLYINGENYINRLTEHQAFMNNVLYKKHFINFTSVMANMIDGTCLNEFKFNYYDEPDYEERKVPEVDDLSGFESKVYSIKKPGNIKTINLFNPEKLTCQYGWDKISEAQEPIKNYIKICGSSGDSKIKDNLFADDKYEYPTSFFEYNEANSSITQDHKHENMKNSLTKNKISDVIKKLLGFEYIVDDIQKKLEPEDNSKKLSNPKNIKDIFEDFLELDDEQSLKEEGQNNGLIRQEKFEDISTSQTNLTKFIYNFVHSKKEKEIEREGTENGESEPIVENAVDNIKSSSKSSSEDASKTL